MKSSQPELGTVEEGTQQGICRKRQGAMLLFYLLCMMAVAMFLLPEVGVLPRGYCTGIGIVSLVLLLILQTGRGFYRARATHAAGLDFLDISSRIEKRFGVRVVKEDWETLCCKRRPPDVSVGELHDLSMREGAFM
jgi:hypothetical protein